MININKLKAKFVEKGYITQESQAKVLEMSTSTYKNKLKKKIFNSDEICKMIKLLEIKNPNEIFFFNLLPKRLKYICYFL